MMEDDVCMYSKMVFDSDISVCMHVCEREKKRERKAVNPLFCEDCDCLARGIQRKYDESRAEIKRETFKTLYLAQNGKHAATSEMQGGAELDCSNSENCISSALLDQILF